tara:strand:- start:12435 stop:13157 length:723 start_codon:yes stop_codon:yes gene_type:complete
MDRCLPKPKALKSPSWRLEEALSPSLELEDLEDSYLSEANALVTGEKVPSRLEEAYLLYYLPQSRAIMNSLMISDISSTKLAEALGTIEDVVITYSKVFFDKAVFPNRLVLKEYIDMLPEFTSVEANYKALMRASYSLGFEYILWKMSLTKSSLADMDLKDLASGVLSDSYWRAREHKGFSITDTRSKESRSWIPSVIKTIEMNSNMASGGASDIETLRLRLVKADTTVSIEDFSEEIKG